MNDHLSGKELFIRFTARAFRKLLSFYVFSCFPFGFEGRMWDLIVSVPDHCLSFYFTKTEHARQKTTFSQLQVNGKVFRQSKSNNSEGNGQTMPDLQLVRAFILVLITCKFDEDLIIRPVAGHGSLPEITLFLSEAF